MPDPTDIRRQLEDPTLKATTLTDVVNVSAVLKNLADAEKSRADALEAQNKSEVLRFWIPVLAPTVTAFALVATLAIQMYQLHANTVMQRAAAEDAAWRDALKDLGATSGPGIPIALHQLRSFLESKRYGRSARELSVTLLADLSPDAVEILLPDVLRETNWSNVSDLARLARGLDRTWTALGAKADAAKERVERISAEPEIAPGRNDRLQAAQQQFERENDMVNGVVENLRMTSRGIAGFIRNNHASRPAGYLDLKGADLLDADLANLQLINVDLSNVYLRDGRISNSCICSSLVVDGILTPAQFDRSQWNNTAWWRASRISPLLLAYLEGRYPFDAQAKYSGDPIAAGEYGAAVKRLHAANDAKVPSRMPSPG